MEYLAIPLPVAAISSSVSGSWHWRMGRDIMSVRCPRIRTACLSDSIASSLTLALQNRGAGRPIRRQRVPAEQAGSFFAASARVVSTTTRWRRMRDARAGRGSFLRSAPPLPPHSAWVPSWQRRLPHPSARGPGPARRLTRAGVRFFLSRRDAAGLAPQAAAKKYDTSSDAIPPAPDSPEHRRLAVRLARENHGYVDLGIKRIQASCSTGHRVGASTIRRFLKALKILGGVQPGRRHARQRQLRQDRAPLRLS